MKRHQPQQQSRITQYNIVWIILVMKVGGLTPLPALACKPTTRLMGDQTYSFKTVIVPYPYHFSVIRCAVHKACDHIQYYRGPRAACQPMAPTYPLRKIPGASILYKMSLPACMEACKDQDIPFWM
jgi:hypothetical protein